MIIANTRQDQKKKEKKKKKRKREKRIVINKNKKDVDRLRVDNGRRIFWVEDRASFFGRRADTPWERNLLVLLLLLVLVGLILLLPCCGRLQSLE